MKRRVLNVIVAVFPLVAWSLATAQDANETERTFLLRSMPMPADPDPTTQSPEQRLVTLRKRMAEANALLKEGKVEQCLNEFIDPFWIARAAASLGATIDELFERRILGDKKNAKDFADTFVATLDANMKAEPKWLLNGRTASFITNGNSHTAEFWIYLDGKWRISPED